MGGGEMSRYTGIYAFKTQIDYIYYFTIIFSHDISVLEVMLNNENLPCHLKISSKYSIKWMYCHLRWFLCYNVAMKILICAFLVHMSKYFSRRDIQEGIWGAEVHACWKETFFNGYYQLALQEYQVNSPWFAAHVNTW